MNMLRTKQIGVLALQETHLNEKTTSQIRTVFDKKIMVLNSGAPHRLRDGRSGGAWQMGRQRAVVSGGGANIVVSLWWCRQW